LAQLDIGDLDFQERGRPGAVQKDAEQAEKPGIHYRPDQAVAPSERQRNAVATLAGNGRTAGTLFVRISSHGHLAKSIIREPAPRSAMTNGRNMTGPGRGPQCRRCAIGAG